MVARISTFEPILLIHNKTKYKLFLATINAILVPVFVYYLVIELGINGAPLGVLISNIISSLILIILTRDLVKINFKEIIRSIIILIIVSLAFCLFELNWLIKIFILLLLLSIEILNVKFKKK